MNAALALVGLALISGCGNFSYYRQSVSGHLSMLSQARPVKEWLADPATPAPLRDQLLLSQRLRDFAVSELALPDNASYRRYADLKRPAAVWNVAAAPALSLQLRTWCAPVAGCVGYRGYFDRAPANALLQSLRDSGWDAALYGVPAYSTLGRLPDGFFSDPLLNTFIAQPESELARLMFHELAHQVAYAEGDTAFNESFATAVERLGRQRWLEQQATAAVREEAARVDARRKDFRRLTLETRAELAALYARTDLEDGAKRHAKAHILARMRARHQALKEERWAGYAGYDAWFEQANNASLSMQGVYDDLVPRFETLFLEQGRDFRRFYVEVQRLSIMPQAQRHAALLRLKAAR